MVSRTAFKKYLNYQTVKSFVWSPSLLDNLFVMENNLPTFYNYQAITTP